MLVKLETGASGGSGQFYWINNIDFNSSSLSVNCGFKPKKIILVTKNCVNYTREYIYDEDDITATKDYLQVYFQSAGGTLGSTNCKFNDSNGGFASINSNGFTLKSNTYANCYGLVVG